MARAKTPKKKAPPAASKKPKAGGAGAGKKSGGGGPQMGIGDFMQEQFEQNAGKKKRG